MSHLVIHVTQKNLKHFAVYEALSRFLCVASIKAHVKDGNMPKASPAERWHKPYRCVTLPRRPRLLAWPGSFFSSNTSFCVGQAFLIASQQ